MELKTPDWLQKTAKRAERELNRLPDSAKPTWFKERSREKTAQALATLQDLNEGKPLSVKIEPFSGRPHWRADFRDETMWYDVHSYTYQEVVLDQLDFALQWKEQDFAPYTGCCPPGCDEH